MRTRLTLIPLLTFSFGSMFLNAQNFFIGQPTITTCSGTLYDSGGQNADYGNNEDLTTVICPDQIGGYVSLVFFTFDLSTAGNQDDALAIYDGNTTSAPLLGSFTAQLLSNLIVTASEENSSGCLTLVFTSNGTGTGNILAGIHCYVPCTAPFASFTTSHGDTARLCIGDTLFVDGSSSQAANGQVLNTWRWSLGYQLPIVSDQPVDTLIMQMSGAYHLRLVVTDSSSCVSDPSATTVVVISGPPSFAGTTVPNIACVPDIVMLTGNAAPAVITLLPSSGTFYGEGILLPDDVGAPFNSVATVTSAQPEAIINVDSDLGDICIDMEHSFIGDLHVELECPNGQSVILHQQGGGGTFLGDANDQGPGPGTCWTYCFNSDPDHGTWAESAINGSMPSLVQASQGTALAPGSYTSVDPLSNLIGCPINGNWTLTFVDLWGADNGYLCSWSLGFTTPSDTLSLDLTPTISLGHPDSAFWSGMNSINLVGADATASVPVEGQYTYTFTVMDSYGCSFDTTLTVTGAETPTVDAGSDVLVCSEPVVLVGSAYFPPAEPCTYNLSLVGAGWSGGAHLTCTIDGVSTDYGPPPSSVPLAVSSGSTIALSYTGGSNDSECRFTLFGAQSQVVYQSPWGPLSGIHYEGLVDCGADPSLMVQWTPSLGISNPSSTGTLIEPPASGWYVFTGSLLDGSCPASDSIWVTNSYGIASITYDVETSMLCCEPSILPMYRWYLNGEVYWTPPELNCLMDPPYGIWSVVGFSDAECAMISDTIRVCPSIEIGHGLDMVFTTQDLGTYEWTFNGSVIPNSNNASVPFLGNGTYSVTVTMPGGCVVGAFEDLILSITERSGSGPVVVLPNPSTGTLRLIAAFASSTTSSLEVFDMAGRKVWTTPTTFSNTGISDELMLSLSSGTYTVLITTPGGLGSGKLMIE